MKLRLEFAAEVEIEVEGDAAALRDDPEAYLDAVERARETVQAEEIMLALRLVGDEIVEDGAQ